MKKNLMKMELQIKNLAVNNTNQKGYITYEHMIMNSNNDKKSATIPKTLLFDNDEVPFYLFDPKLAENLPTTVIQIIQPSGDKYLALLDNNIKCYVDKNSKVYDGSGLEYSEIKMNATFPPNSTTNSITNSNNITNIIIIILIILILIALGVFVYINCKKSNKNSEKINNENNEI